MSASLINFCILSHPCHRSTDMTSTLAITATSTTTTDKKDGPSYPGEVVKNTSDEKTLTNQSQELTKHNIQKDKNTLKKVYYEKAYKEEEDEEEEDEEEEDEEEEDEEEYDEEDDEEEY
jgi:hypothetical protein